MNLSKLFEMQKALDERIIEKKGLQGQDLLPNTILALYAELGELLNEWRWFKHWSDDREPRTLISTGICTYCAGTGSVPIDVDGAPDCWNCGGEGETTKNPLLEEYVDCLHFILSLGLQVGIKEVVISELEEGVYAKDMFFEVFHNLTRFELFANGNKDELAKGNFLGARIYNDWRYLMESFVRLGELLGFTWNQVEQAYYDKNKVNHERQESGY